MQFTSSQVGKIHWPEARSNLSCLLSLTSITTNRSYRGCVDYSWKCMVRVRVEKEKVNLFGKLADKILEELDAKFLAIYITFQFELRES